MKKLCIIDFDGTMFDTLTDVAKCFNQTFKKLGLETFDFQFYKESLGGNIDEIIGIILKDKNTPENIEKVKNMYEKIYKKDKKENTKPFPHIEKFLTQLEENNKILAINSNRKPDSINYLINQFLPDVNFIDIQGHVTTNPSKPDPYGVNTIIKKAGVTREETVYIGDSITDIKTAKNANIDCIIVTWGYAMEETYENEYPLKIVSKTSEILDIINS